MPITKPNAIGAQIVINGTTLDDQQADLVHQAVKEFSEWLDSDETRDFGLLLQHFRRRAHEIVALMESHAK